MANVSFKTAKLAQEKGFDKDCKDVYFNEERLDFGFSALKNSHLSKNKSGYACSSPIQSELQKWLRETHKIHVSVAPWKESFVSSNRKQHRTVYEGNIIDEKDDWRIIQLHSFSKKYEECLEECLIFALKSIT